MTATIARLLATGLAAGLLLAGCGGDDEPADNAVEARVENTVELDGVEYRVTLFRQINANAAAGDALWEGGDPGDGIGLYAAFVQACGVGDDASQMSTELILEDAFGQVFEPQPEGTADEFEYEPVRLDDGECAPRAGSPADQAYGGGALVFEVPFESISERPFVLQIGAPDGDGEARIQVDV